MIATSIFCPQCGPNSQATKLRKRYFVNAGKGRERKVRVGWVNRCNGCGWSGWGAPPMTPARKSRVLERAGQLDMFQGKGRRA